MPQKNISSLESREKEPFRLVKNIIGVIFLFGIPAIFIKIIIQNTKRNTALEGNTALVRAIVISEKNFYGNSPVSHTFTYSYRFKLNGKAYEGDTRNPDLQIGDTLTVKYVPESPEYNEPVK